jgi:hypothetical protein
MQQTNIHRKGTQRTQRVFKSSFLVFCELLRLMIMGRKQKLILHKIIHLLSTIHPIFKRGDAVYPAELFAQIIAVVKSYLQGDIGDSLVSIYQ